MADGLNLNFRIDIYYTTRNNERNDFDMIDFSKLMELMSKAAENRLNESTVMMMANDKLTKRSEYTIRVRNRTEGYGSSISHGPSIKLMMKGDEVAQQSVPNVPIVIGAKDLFNEHYQKNNKKREHKKALVGFYSFLYTYQMEIIAFWYAKDKRLNDYYKEKFDGLRISQAMKANPKSEEELSADRARITDEVKAALGTDVTVSFGG